jgi:phenylacetate-CoA ligase
MILSYPGSLNNLATYLLSHDDTPEMFHLKVILGYGEGFPENLHQKLRRLFNCNIVSLYSNQENGLMAVECLQNKEFHVNSASYNIEILKFDSEEPAGFEELGRIVVTDLFNHAMPLIRYDTGDTGTWKETGDCSWHTQILSSIQGKVRDFIFDTTGTRISPSSVGVLMWPYDGLLQYQFIQHGEKQYTLKLNEGENHYDEAIFIQLFKDLVGQDAVITIERVSEIPVLKSGKHKPVVNNYKKIMV